MSVQTIECQISTVLMKRFLDGDDLPQELLDGLEQHLKACPACREIVNNERVTIEEILDGPAEPTGVAAFIKKFSGKKTAGGFVTTHPTEALVHAAQTSRTAPPGLAVFKNPKVLMLSSALAVTLIAMSTVLKDPTKLLGQKASDSVKSAPAGDEEGHGETTPDPKPAPDETGGTDEGHTSDTHSTDTPKPTDPEAGHAEAGSSSQADTKSHSETGSQGHPDSGASSHEPKTGDKPTHGSEQSGSGKEQHPELPNDPRVPGEKTLKGSVVIVGGGQHASKPSGEKAQPHKEQKPAGTASKTVSKASTSSHAKPATTSHSVRKPAGKRTTTKRQPVRAASTKPKAVTKPKATTTKRPGGVKVYDSNGKPIN